jgi:hypothetical protein
MARSGSTTAIYMRREMLTFYKAKSGSDLQYQQFKMFKIRHTNCLNAMESHRNMQLSKDHSLGYKIYSMTLEGSGMQRF